MLSGIVIIAKELHSRDEASSSYQTDNTRQIYKPLRYLLNPISNISNFILDGINNVCIYRTEIVFNWIRGVIFDFTRYSRKREKQKLFAQFELNGLLLVYGLFLVEIVYRWFSSEDASKSI